MEAGLETDRTSRSSGKERDAETGLDYFGARYYGSNMGRFMTPDWSANPTPVPYAKLDNPQTLNLYSYVENNPLSSVDPDGHGKWGCLLLGRCDPPPPPPPPRPPNVPKPQLKNGTPVYNPPPPSTPEPAPIQYKTGVPAPADNSQLGKLLKCTNKCMAPLPLTVTATNEKVPGHPEIHQSNTPHGRGEAADILTGKSNADEGMICASACGAGFGQNEYDNPSPHSTGPHDHIQTTPGQGGSRGDLPPQEEEQ